LQVFPDMSVIIDGYLCFQVLVGESLIKAEDPGRAIAGLFGKELMRWTDASQLYLCCWLFFLFLKQICLCGYCVCSNHKNSACASQWNHRCINGCSIADVIMNKRSIMQNKIVYSLLGSWPFLSLGRNFDQVLSHFTLNVCYCIRFWVPVSGVMPPQF
jgi:hypothetical protein